MSITIMENLWQVGGDDLSAPGDAAIYLVLFGQDVHGPIHPALRSDEREYQRSLKKMLALEADLLLEGHFGIYRGKTAVRQFIQSYIR